MTDDPDKNLEKRMDRLEADLASRQDEERKSDGPSEESRSGYRQAVKISSEFVSAIVVGAFLGYLLDRFAGTAPWGLVIFLFLGFAAGVMNVLRTVGAVKSPHPVDKLGAMNKEKNKKK